MSAPSDRELLDALKRWVTEGRLSQTDAAARTGIAQSTLSRLLAGRVRRVSPDTAELLRRTIPSAFQRPAARASVSEPSAHDPSRKRVVFVSSTYLDNAERRSWVFEAIERAGMVPHGMERWTANPLPAHELSVHRVAEADVYLGILAWRYGWIPEGETKSITELEYDEAVHRGLPRLLFWIDQPLGQVNVATEFDPDDRWTKQARLDAFKDRIKREQTAMPFKDEKLEVLVLQALTEWERGLVGGSTSQIVRRQAARRDARKLQLASYLQRIVTECSKVSLAGFGGSLRAKPLLEELFVEIDLTHGGREDQRARPEEAWKRGEEEREGSQLRLLDALQRVSSNERLRGLVLLGHPGSGKTTLLRHLAFTVARQGALALGPGEQELVPVLVPLRRLKGETSLRALATRLVANADAGFDPDFADWLWTENRLLLLVDGLDEVPRERRPDVRDWIESVAQGDKGDILVVTCRHEGYLRSAQFDADFLPLRLRPLSDAGAEEFIRNWYRAVETEQLPPAATARDVRAAERDAARTAQELIERLNATRATARIYELGHNPLMLTAICLVHRERKKLPERAADLYESAVRVLLELWREQKGLPPSLDPRKVQGVLQAVALWLHRVEGRTQASEDDLNQLIALSMQEVGWRSITPTAFLATVRDESGLFTGWSAESYGFLHLAFQEYLAALESYRRVYAVAGDVQAFREAVDELARRIESSWWREVLQLLFAVDDKGLAGQLLRAWLRRTDLLERVALVQQCVASLRSFDPTPFRELLRLPFGEGLWANREAAAGILAEVGEMSINEGDIEPALALLDEPATSTARVEDQLVAMRLVERFAPDALMERADALTRHPRAELRKAAVRVTRLAIDVLALEPRGSIRGSAAGSSQAHGRLSGAWVEERSGVEFVQIPAGSFLMGSPETERGRYADEGPQHEVTLEPFLLAVHPVTNEQYARFLAANPSVKPPNFWGDRSYNQPAQPVVGVSWDDAQAFCKWAGLVLPTEAQWEYACRARTTTRFWSGDADEDLDRVAWYGANASGRLHSVAEKPPNPWGLFDVHGNVWEWSRDKYDSYTLDTRGGDGERESRESHRRVFRGGSFTSASASSRASYRSKAHPTYRNPGLGFRPARRVAPG